MKDGQQQTEMGGMNSPRVLFKPGTWLSKIDFINHLVLFNNVLITVLSEKEGGKTSFSSLLLDNLDQQIKPVFMTAIPPCDREQMINTIAAQFHLNIGFGADVTTIVSQINERKAHVLLVIDDAQHVPESLIKEFMMAIKNQDNFGFFHLCLVSDYSVVASLNNLVADQFANLVHTLELGSLNESETRTYALQRAMAARLINKPLTDAQLKKFYQMTKGNVAKINSSLESFVLKCSVPEKSNKLFLVKRVGMAFGALCISGLTYLYLNNHQVAPTQEVLTSALSPAVPKKIEPVILPAQQLISYIPSLHDSSTLQLVHDALPRRQNLDELANEESSVNTVALVDKVIVIPTIKNTSPTTVPKPAVVATQESKIIPIAQTEQQAVAKKAISSSSKASGYTIQLVASHKIDDINRFKQSNSQFSATHVRHFTNAKGTWYILTIGEYKTREQAQIKAKQLPSGFAKLKPWIRPISGLTKMG